MNTQELANVLISVYLNSPSGETFTLEQKAAILVNELADFIDDTKFSDMLNDAEDLYDKEYSEEHVRVLVPVMCKLFRATNTPDKRTAYLSLLEAVRRIMEPKGEPTQSTE